MILNILLFIPPPPQVMRLPDGLQLYRGLGGLTDLPDSFFCRDKQVPAAPARDPALKRV